jgi:acyl-CoA thioesterase-1
MAGGTDMTRAYQHGVFRTLCFLLFVLIFPGSALSADSPRETVILAFGDSLSAGYGLPAADSIPARLEALLRKKGHAVTVVNAGVSGDTTSGGRARLDWVLASLDPAKPTLVMLELGANDALRGVSPDIARANLDAMLTELRERGLDVLLCGMLAPPNMGRDYGARFNAIYPELAKKHKVPLYPFFLDGVATKADLNQQDGLHPNAKGAAIVAERLLPVVDPLLRKLTVARSK